MRTIDWAQTPLGLVERWPQSLRTALSLVLASRHPINLCWGKDLVQLYNDAYRPILGAKHPNAIGRPVRETFAEIWDELGPLMQGVLERGESTFLEDQLFPLERGKGFLEECYFDIAHSPIRDESGGIGGMFVTSTETSQRVLGERRLRTLHELADQGHQTAEAACLKAARVLAGNRRDLPFALLYLADARGQTLRLAGAVGLEAGEPGAPAVLDLHEAAAAPEVWPLRQVMAEQQELQLEGVQARVGPLPGGPWPERPSRALVLPLSQPGQPAALGVLVAGLSSRLVLDAAYRDFLGLLATQVGAMVATARAFEAEKERAHALAALDRAKTAFFSNISHEFRTPLTLMVGPLEDMLASDRVSGQERQHLARIHRGAQRLLKLVNALLDFSRVEAGRTRGSFEPTDLAALTSGLASSFESLVAMAGLRLVVDCPPLPEPAWVDRDMWEKIVLNLLSNAFKFTFEGEIAVRLRWRGERVELSVQDTGTGVPEQELPRIFERFHRVEGARGRSYEGSGIGLALVQELVALHGGGVRVESAVGRGSTFTVSIPAVSGGPPSALAEEAQRPVSTTPGAEAFIHEAAQWLSRRPDAPPAAGVAPRGPAPLAAAVPDAVAHGRVLVADDNADLREYVRGVLERRFDVETVADGLTALAAAREQRPHAVLTDVMMPGLDGFGLLRELKADPRTAHIPVVLLSARAGEEATVEGLAAGADDYLVKPFSARELLARVEGVVKAARAQEALRLRANFEQQLIGIVSHDLRNPVSAILLGAVSLLRTEDLSARQTQSVVRIQSAAERAIRMIRDLLDFTQARLGGGIRIERRPADLHELTRGVVDEVEATHAGRQVQVLRNGDGRGEWDPDRLAQVVQNLVTNALKYSPEGTPVRVEIYGEAGAVTLSVHNQGVPIPPEHLGRLFEPMHRATGEVDATGRSVGLGLYIVKHLVDAHGGTVDVRSSAEEGTTFTVRLPRAAPPGRPG